MKVACRYKNRSLDAFRQFCIQNRDKPISFKLTTRSELFIGASCNYYFNSPREPHPFLPLADRVFHPANNGLEGIKSMHIGLNNSFTPWEESAYDKDMFAADYGHKALCLAT